MFILLTLLPTAIAPIEVVQTPKDLEDVDSRNVWADYDKLPRENGPFALDPQFHSHGESKWYKHIIGRDSQDRPVINLQSERAEPFVYPSSIASLPLLDENAKPVRPKPVAVPDASELAAQAYRAVVSRWGATPMAMKAALAVAGLGAGYAYLRHRSRSNKKSQAKSP